MKSILLLSALFFPGLVIHGQSQLQHVVGTSGGSGQNETFAMEWTIGETFVATYSGSGLVLTHGFQQLVVTGIQSYESLAYGIEIYPNPTGNRLVLSLEDREMRDFQYLLYDLNGKLLEQEAMVSDQTIIGMSGYPAGLYLLKIVQAGREIGTFEIAKH